MRREGYFPRKKSGRRRFFFSLASPNETVLGAPWDVRKKIDKRGFDEMFIHGAGGIARIIQTLRRKATAQEQSAHLSRNFVLDRPRKDNAPLPPRGFTQ
jgi:hypothetical protein